MAGALEASLVGRCCWDDRVEDDRNPYASLTGASWLRPRQGSKRSWRLPRANPFEGLDITKERARSGRVRTTTKAALNGPWHRFGASIQLVCNPPDPL
jgi:hypothetical protein